MQTYTRAEVIKNTKPYPSWMNFEVPVVYTKETLSLAQVLQSLHTVWDDIEDFERPTFMDYARTLQTNSTSEIPVEKREKIKSLYESKYIDDEMAISCFLVSDLKTLLPEEYPMMMKIPDDTSYVVEDGNHRLAALALRILDGEDLGELPVIVFFGRIA